MSDSINYIKYSDEALLLHLRQGKKAAFEEIFNRYWYRLYKIVYVRIRSHEEAEEIVQDLFAAIWQKRRSLQIQSISDYLFVAVQHRTISHIRAEMARDKHWGRYRDLVPRQSMATEEAVSFNELNTEIERAISNLPEKSQQVFRLNRLEGRSMSEIAEYMKMSRRTAEYHLTKSLRELRLQLKDFILSVILIALFF